MANTRWEKASFLAAWAAIFLTLGGHVYEYVTKKHELRVSISSVTSNEKTAEIGLMLTNSGSFEETVLGGYLSIGDLNDKGELAVFPRRIKFKNKCFEPVSIKPSSSKFTIAKMPTDIHPVYVEEINAFPNYKKQKEKYIASRKNAITKTYTDTKLSLHLILNHTLL